MSLGVELLGLAIHAVSWTKGAIVFEWGLRVLNSNEAIVSSGVDCSDALTVFDVLDLGSVELVPCSEILLRVKVLLSVGLRATLPETLLAGQSRRTFNHLANCLQSVLQEGVGGLSAEHEGSDSTD